MEGVAGVILRLSAAPPAVDAVSRAAGHPVAEVQNVAGRLATRTAEAARRAANLACPLAVAGEAGEGQPRAVVVTLGLGVEEEVRRLGLAGRMGEALLLDAAGNALLAAACREAATRLTGSSKEWAWLAPGCGDHPISLVPEVVREAGAGAVGVEVLPGGMLRPEKTVAGWIVEGPGAGPELCPGCASPVCPWAGGR